MFLVMLRNFSAFAGIGTRNAVILWRAADRKSGAAGAGEINGCTRVFWRKFGLSGGWCGINHVTERLEQWGIGKIAVPGSFGISVQSFRQNQIFFYVFLTRSKYVSRNFPICFVSRRSTIPRHFTRK